VAYEFPSFNKLEVTKTSKFSVDERAHLNEFFDITTPVPNNYLNYFILDGDDDMLILYIDKLVYTLKVVKRKLVGGSICWVYWVQGGKAIVLSIIWWVRCWRLA